MTMYSICPIQSWIHWEQILLSQDSPMMSNQIQNGLNMASSSSSKSVYRTQIMVMAFTIDFKCALVFAVGDPFLFLVVFVIMFLSIPLFKKQGKLTQ